MQLARFLNSVFKKDGFILEDAYTKNYIIGSPESDKPIKVKILDKKLHYKLLLIQTYILEKLIQMEV
jgi:cyclopropane-fatty-acyl-phospholipid synthase